MTTRFPASALLFSLLLQTSGASEASCIGYPSGVGGGSWTNQFNVTLNYSAKDDSAVRDELPRIFEDRLEADASGTNQSFSVANGVGPNFIYYIYVNNDGYDHYSLYVQVNGLGYGQLFTYSSRAPYSDPTDMINDAADTAFRFIHDGWQCN